MCVCARVHALLTSQCIVAAGMVIWLTQRWNLYWWQQILMSGMQMWEMWVLLSIHKVSTFLLLKSYMRDTNMWVMPGHESLCSYNIPMDFSFFMVLVHWPTCNGVLLLLRRCQCSTLLTILKNTNHINIPLSRFELLTTFSENGGY